MNWGFPQTQGPQTSSPSESMSFVGLGLCPSLLQAALVVGNQVILIASAGNNIMDVALYHL